MGLVVVVLISILVVLGIAFLIMTSCCFFYFGFRPEHHVSRCANSRFMTLKRPCDIIKKLVTLNVDYAKIQDSKALIFLIHGLGEHSGLYEEVKNQCLANGFSFYSLDLRGYGKSDGARNCIYSMNEHVEDIKYALSTLIEKEDEIFILGHSFGSLLALQIEIQYGFEKLSKGKVKGMILTGTTCIVDYTKFPRSWILFAKVISKIFPSFPISAPSHVSNYVKNLKFREYFMQDELVDRSFIKVSMAMAILESVHCVNSKMDVVSIPVLFCHGQMDNVIKKDGSVYAYKNCSSEDKELKLFRGLRHNILHESYGMDKNPVLIDILEWIEKRI